MPEVQSPIVVDYAVEVVLGLYSEVVLQEILVCHVAPNVQVVEGKFYQGGQLVSHGAHESKPLKLNGQNGRRSVDFDLLQMLVVHFAVGAVDMVLATQVLDLVEFLQTVFQVYVVVLL